jgi:hypothetical protein
VSDTRLPALVTRYVERSRVDVEPPPRQVRIGQSGEMWLKPGGRSLRFTAVEEFAVHDVAFSWRARFRVLPLVSLRVVDVFAAGDGMLEGRLFGLPVMRQKGPEVSIGEAMRYLAEIVWVPHAIVANRVLEWRELDGEIELATQVGSTRAAVQLEFDSNGDIVGARSDSRPYREGKTYVPRPWAGTFGEHALVGGVRVPTRGEVGWELPEGRFTYWRGTINSLEQVR